MNTFFFTHAEPKFLPPVMLDPSETVCGPRYTNLRNNGRYRYLHTPAGVFDVQQVLEKVRPHDHPNLLLIHADSTGGCMPRNLPENCIKVLLVGDTHHLQFPIQKMIQYAGSEAFDAIILWNRQHAHFFTELGFQNVYWLPGLTFAIPTTRQFEEKTHDLCFFGQLGKHHPRRTKIIKSIVDSNITLEGGTLPRRDSLELVAKSRASLNISLNGELNLRVFESTQNGALLYTDRLSELTGLNHFYKDGESIITYFNSEELITKIRHYENHADEAAQIARQGRKVTNRYFSFSARRDTFFNLINNAGATEAFQLTDETRCQIRSSNDASKKATFRRIQVYEVAQELHRTLENLQITLTAGATPFIASDLSDLVRANLTMAIDESFYQKSALPLLNKLGMDKLTRIDPQNLSSHKSDLLIVSKEELHAIIPSLGKQYSNVCIWDFDPNNKAINTRILESGYEPIPNSTQGVFQIKRP